MLHIINTDTRSQICRKLCCLCCTMKISKLQSAISSLVSNAEVLSLIPPDEVDYVCNPNAQ